MRLSGRLRNALQKWCLEEGALLNVIKDNLETGYAHIIIVEITISVCEF
jgi:hypothetical protein